MRPFLLCFTLLLASACHSFKPFTFVQMSDPQIGFIDGSPSFVHSDSLMKAAVDAANALKPACVIVTGDLVNDATDPLQDAIYQARLSEIEAPVYAIPGNHDYLRITREAYIALRGYDRYSFREGGCAFIGIDSNCIKDELCFQISAGGSGWSRGSFFRPCPCLWRMIRFPPSPTATLVKKLLS